MKKLISTLFILFCLFSGMKAFSQVVVSGGNLKAPIRYNTIDEMKKDYKKLKKAASKGTVELKFPVGSNLRTEKDLRAIFESVFNDMEWYISTESGENKLVKWDEVFAPYSEMQYLKKEITVSDCIEYYKFDISFSFLNSNNKFYTLEEFYFTTPTRLAKAYVEEQKKELQEQRIANEKAGLGYVTNAEAETERNKNESEGLGKFTNFELKQIEENEKAGYGKFTNSELEKQRSENESAGFGRVTNIEKIERERTIAETKKKIQPYLKKAKDYEAKKQWAFALDAYYDAMGIEGEPLGKKEAAEGYMQLAQAIESGKPGLGKFNEFSMHDEWKKLLIDAEKLGSTICKWELKLGKLTKGDLDYKTRTATYHAKIDFELSDRYKKTIEVIEVGFKGPETHQSDWTDLPWAGPAYNFNAWPRKSVSASSAKNGTYDINGAKVFEITQGHKQGYEPGIYNAFSVFCTSDKRYDSGYSYYDPYLLYDCKFNIVDENGKALLNAQRCLLKLTANSVRDEQYFFATIASRASCN